MKTVIAMSLLVLPLTACGGAIDSGGLDEEGAVVQALGGDEDQRRTGTIASVSPGGGVVIDRDTGGPSEFERPGADRDFVVGDDVVFITITTPKGKVIVKSIIKK